MRRLDAQGPSLESGGLSPVAASIVQHVVEGILGGVLEAQELGQAHEDAVPFDARAWGRHGRGLRGGASTVVVGGVPLHHTNVLRDADAGVP